MKNTQSHLKTSYLNCQGLETNSFCLPTVLNPSETKALRVVSGSNEHWRAITAKKTYGQEEFFKNPSPYEREVPYGCSRSRKGLAKQLNAIRSKVFKTYLQLIAIESEFGKKELYGSRKHYAVKLGVNVKTISRWDKVLVSLKLINLRRRPGRRTNQKNISMAMSDSLFLALLDNVSVRKKKVINNFNPNVPLSITYGKDINISYKLKNKKERLNINACAHTRESRKENSLKRVGIEKEKEVLLRVPQNKWMNYYFNAETHELPANLKEVRSWMVLAATFRPPVATARLLCDLPPDTFSNTQKALLCQFAPQVLRRAIADLNASENGRYKVLHALCLHYSSELELTRNLKYLKIANWISDNQVRINPRKTRDEFEALSPFWYYSRSLVWLQQQIKTISTWKYHTEQKGYEIPIACEVLEQLEDYLEWALMNVKPRPLEERSYQFEGWFYEARMRDLTEGHVEEEERVDIRSSIQEWITKNT